MKLFTESDCDLFQSLYTITNGSIVSRPAFSLEKANEIFEKWLANGTVAYGHELYLPAKGWADFSPTQAPQDTHRAILVCVEPLEQDSAEKVLSALLEILEKGNGILDYQFALLKERAKLLSEKKR